MAAGVVTVPLTSSQGRSRGHGLNNDDNNE